MVIKFISLYLFIGVMFLSYMFANSFVRSKSSYAKMLGALSFILQVYLLGYLLEINAESLKEMLFWNKVQYFGVPFLPALWLTVGMLYTGRGKYLQGFRSLAVFGIPILTFIFRMTNDWHHLYYSRIELQNIFGANLMLVHKGPWYFFQMGYGLIALVLCSWFYLQRYRKSAGDEKIQFRLLLLASVLPYLALILVALNAGGIGIDYTALIFPFCVFLIDLALTRYNFLEIGVLAREKVFEDSAAGLVLLNRFNRVVDYNAASISFFSLFKAQIVKEEQLDFLLKDQPDLLDSVRRSEEKVFQLVAEGEDLYIKVNVRGIQSKEEPVGILITFEDVTEPELLRRRLIEMANTDELSGLNNRRRFRELAEEACRRARRYNEQLSLLMIDVDYFKKINDSFGHLAGDAYIRDLAEMLSRTFRKTDIIGRVGGEEFAVVMLNTDAEKAHKKAECFRRSIEEKIMILGQQRVRVTVSIGVAELNKETPDFEALVNRADYALYEAKRSGRNCAVVLKRGLVKD